jgi:endo-1,4-beta-xylanase
MPLTRRQVLAGTAACAIVQASVPAVAARASVPFGAAIHPDPMQADATYRAAFVRHCQVLVGEGGMKWPDLRPTRDQFSFETADRMVEFARSNGLEMRGHTLVWCEVLPDWTRTISSASEAERELRHYIERVMRRYKGRIHSWDVVNEPMADAQPTGRDFRAGLWPRYLGDNYIAMALRTAADADPTAELIINEYGIEGASSGDKRKREAFRQLIRNLKDKGVPLHGIGIQAHIDASSPVDHAGISAFTADMKSLGLKVLITELDVNDQKLPGDIAVRDAAAAKLVGDFLASVGAGIRPSLVCTWGLTDRNTWIPMYFKRADGLPNRPLPLDAQFEPKPMLQVIKDFCRAQA